MGAVPKGANLFTGTHTVLQASIYLREEQVGPAALPPMAQIVLLLANRGSGLLQACACEDDAFAASPPPRACFFAA
jgi:hypothetical protein